MPKAAEILREAAAYVPFLEQTVQQKKNAILRIRAEAKHHEAETKRRERELRQIVKVGMTSKEDTQPFVEQVAGYSWFGFFPKEAKTLSGCFLDGSPNQNSKVKNGTLNHCTIPQLHQAIFALTDYSSLNTLNQDQLVMILQYLHQKEFHVGRYFEELMAKWTEDKIIPSLGFIACITYYAGKTHYSENCHRDLPWSSRRWNESIHICNGPFE